MSFKIDGAEWTPKTALEHARNIINRVNQLLQENGVQDSQGNIVQLKQTYSNALYLLSLGDGQRLAENDAKLSQAINSFNIELCDDQQIQNLLPIAAMTQNPGSYSTLKLTVTASEDGACTIPAGTTASYENVKFIVQTEAIISAGTSQTIDTVCDTLGPVVVLTGEVTAFDTEIANLESVENLTSSQPGVAPETKAELRQRLINGDTIRYSLDGCKNALEELTGISYARVYFNYNISETITLPGGVVVQPRTAYIVVYGESSKIAEVYANYQNAETQNAPGAGARAHSQNYITTSGQEIEIKYDDAEIKNVYVRIVLEEDTELTDQVENQLKRDMIKASATWSIGQHVTGLLAAKPFVNVEYAKVAYVEVSDDGETWTNHVEVGCNVIPTVEDSTISVINVGDE